MNSTEGNGDQQPSACATPDGCLWFPTTRGVVKVDPERLLRDPVPPPVVIEQVTADNTIVFGDGAPKSKADRTGISLAPGRARVLAIRYTSSSFSAPEKVQFRYRLHGYDQSWQYDDHNRREALYTNLRPGSYRFEVWARNHDGVESAAGELFAFSLQPHVYETAGFYVACAVFVVGATVGIQAYRLGVQRRMLHLERDAALHCERSRIAQDVHDDLGASLTQIAILSEVAQRDWTHSETARAHVAKISATARTVVDNLSELVWATNPRNDTLDNFVSYLREFAARFFENASILCRLDFPQSVPDLPLAAELRRSLFLVVKEALHNVLQHSRASQVQITVAFPRSHLSISIRDNGRGFEPQSIASSSNGLRNIRQRVERAGGTVTIQSQPGAGVAIDLRVPLAAAPA
jgi:signal transduction histidine kinase